MSRSREETDAIELINQEFSRSAPSPPTKSSLVYNDECVVSFDTPYCRGGLFVNTHTWLGFGADFVLADAVKSNQRVYLNVQFNLKIKAEDPDAAQALAPTIMGIGVPGGFQTQVDYEVEATYALAVFLEFDHSRLQMLPLGQAPATNPDNGEPDFEFVLDGVSPRVLDVATAIRRHPGMIKKMKTDFWIANNPTKITSKHAMSLVQLPRTTPISMDPSTWRCELRGDVSNLWLNLSTGYIGGGRKQWDGSGGSGGAMNHYEDTGRLYPLCVKLGTITSDGADVWSYDKDEDELVNDPILAKHLLHFGIDMRLMTKTEKTLAEMEVDLQTQYDWNRICESGKPGEKLEPVRDAEYIGLRNIGSSCYMNSVLQVIATIPEIQAKYGSKQSILDAMRAKGDSDYATDPKVQFSKLINALLSDRYTGYGIIENDSKNFSRQEEIVLTNAPSPDNIAPHMFKKAISTNHPSFSTGQQQDASEYHNHLIDKIDRFEISEAGEAERTGSSLFYFNTETKTTCTVTGAVKYSKTGGGNRQSILELRVPTDSLPNHGIPMANTASSSSSASKELDFSALLNSSATPANTSAGDGDTSSESKRQKTDDASSPTSSEEEKPSIPFQACFDSYFGEDSVDMRNPLLGSESVPMVRVTKLKTLPKYLLIKLNRYALNQTTFQPYKIDARIAVPELLDLSNYRAMHSSDRPKDEVLMPESNESSGGGSGKSNEVQVNEQMLSQMCDFGFDIDMCRRALKAVKNSNVDVAVDYLMSHMDELSMPEQIPSSSSGSASLVIPGEVLAHFENMGFSEKQAKAAIISTQKDLSNSSKWNVEIAIDWVLSNMDDLESKVDAAISSYSSSATNSAAATTSTSAVSSGSDVEAADPNPSSTYKLFAFVSHIGRSPEAGHYVCHIKKSEDMGWVIFNDDKVAKSKNPPLEHGFMYFFRRE